MFSPLSLLSFSLLILLAVCQDQDNVDGERCNDVILYDIVKKASKLTKNPSEIRKKSMETMEKVFPLARSMGCICTDHKFNFPEFVNHRYCSVRIENFHCHVIVF